MNAYVAAAAGSVLRDQIRLVRDSANNAGEPYWYRAYCWHLITLYTIALREMNKAPGSDGHLYQPTTH